MSSRPFVEGQTLLIHHQPAAQGTLSNAQVSARGVTNMHMQTHGRTRSLEISVDPNFPIKRLVGRLFDSVFSFPLAECSWC